MQLHEYRRVTRESLQELKGRGWTPTRIARRLFVSVEAVTHWQTGVRSPRGKRLERLREFARIAPTLATTQDRRRDAREAFQLMRERGWTIPMVAGRLGISARRASAWSAGKAAPSTEAMSARLTGLARHVAAKYAIRIARYHGIGLAIVGLARHLGISQRELARRLGARDISYCAKWVNGHTRPGFRYTRAMLRLAIESELDPAMVAVIEERLRRIPIELAETERKREHVWRFLLGRRYRPRP